MKTSANHRRNEPYRLDLWQGQARPIAPVGDVHQGPWSTASKLAILACAGALTVLLVNCVDDGAVSGSEGGGGATLVCEPGEQQSCGCPGGAIGAQVCREDGSGWLDCVGCEDVSAVGGAEPVGGSAAWAGGAGGAANDGGNSGSPGASGQGGAPACIPPDESCVPTIPHMDDDPCCDQPEQGYHCCPVLHVCVVDWWQ